jgi:DNA-binding FadR family transcriptional regulator
MVDLLEKDSTEVNGVLVNDRSQQTYFRLSEILEGLTARKAASSLSEDQIAIIQAIIHREPDWAEMVARRHIREAYQGLMNISSGLYQITPEGRCHPEKPE